MGRYGGFCLCSSPRRAEIQSPVRGGRWCCCLMTYNGALRTTSRSLITCLLIDCWDVCLYLRFVTKRDPMHFFSRRFGRNYVGAMISSLDLADGHRGV